MKWNCFILITEFMCLYIPHCPSVVRNIDTIAWVTDSPWGTSINLITNCKGGGSRVFIICYEGEGGF